jgi:uncharacterized membrane protein YcaP (DUF421 family)
MRKSRYSEEQIISMLREHDADHYPGNPVKHRP